MITLTHNLQKRIERERAARGAPGLLLRLGVDSGGCAGFRYRFSWEMPGGNTAAPSGAEPSMGRNAALEDAVLLENAVLIDPVSLPFLEGATIDFVQTLMGEDFAVINPRATSGCGCGQSFAV